MPCHPRPTPVASPCIHRHLASLRLPHGPTLLVSGSILSQTEQRERAALAVWDALRGRPSATVAELEREVRPVVARIGQALRDLVAAGWAVREGDGQWALVAGRVPG